MLDQRDVTTSAFVDDTGALVTFSLDGNLLAPRAAAVSEPFQALVRAVTSRNATEAKLANAASFDTTQVARGSIAAAFGTQLANATASAASTNLPFVLNGVSVNVDGVAARLIFVSAGQVNFVVPAGVNNGDALDFTINNNGVVSAGKVKIVDGAPGVFSANGTGTGASSSQCARVSADGLSVDITPPPCSVGNASAAYRLLRSSPFSLPSSFLPFPLFSPTLTHPFSFPPPSFLGLQQINFPLTNYLSVNKAL